MKKRCAESPIQPEFTLCGDAFDAPDTEDDVEPFDFAAVGQIVTCGNCIGAIAKLRKAYPRGFKRAC